MKILVCDDSIVNRQILGAYLHKMGHDAIFAENGQQAVELFGQENPDLVLIDVEMPGMDGYEATKAIRASLFEFSGWTPIIFISSHIDDESIVKGIDAGGDDYLSKPVSMPVLQAKIHAMRRLVAMRQNLIDFEKKLHELNEKLMISNQLLSDLSLKDALTGLGNRRAFEEDLNTVRRLASRNLKAISLLMIDVDHFKLYNDSYGHQAGDKCLQKVAEILQKGLQRPADIAARYGGEEFVVVLFDCNLEGALYVAEKIRSQVEALQIPHKRSPIGIVTISIGLSTVLPETSFTNEQLISVADGALYRAKDQGRNRVVALPLN